MVRRSAFSMGIRMRLIPICVRNFPVLWEGLLKFFHSQTLRLVGWFWRLEHPLKGR